MIASLRRKSRTRSILTRGFTTRLRRIGTIWRLTICGQSTRTVKTQKSSVTGRISYEISMAIKANDVDPLVGGVISTDDQVRQHAAGAAGVGAARAAVSYKR